MQTNYGKFVLNSKTVLFNGISFIALVIPFLLSDPVQHWALAHPWSIGLYATFKTVGNLILRVLSTEPIKWERDL